MLQNKFIASLQGKIVFFLGVFLACYYIFFAHEKVDLSFTAEDFKVKTIHSREDFEKIIVKTLYDKMEASCQQEKDDWYHKREPMILGAPQFDSWFNWWIKMSVRSEKSISTSEIEWDSVSDSLNEGNSNMMPSLPCREEAGATPQEVWVQPSESITFSKTNIQKIAVDEGDILKQTKEALYYFSKITSKIYILRAPIAWEKLDLSQADVIASIAIPTNLTLNPELFVSEGRLVYLASKESYNNHHTIVGIYDTSKLAQKQVSLIKVFETKWEYFKSRLVNNSLYVISDFSLAPLKEQFCNQVQNAPKSSFWAFMTFFTWVKFSSYGVNQELYDTLSTELESYGYHFPSQNLDADGNADNLKDFQIFYTEKDLKESIQNLNFNVISMLDIENPTQQTKQSLVFGNLKNWEIHMTQDNLYLVNSYYQPEKWKCEYIDICFKEFASNNFTSLSKITFHDKDLEYIKTALIPWRPLNQYSMDEDDWYFRIFTALYDGNRDAGLFVFDNQLNHIWDIENIKPWEEFKSARFIGDKAYLVTFRQTDPLFVIDLHVPSTPKVVGELQIPWYSSYLHPYGKIGTKQYLIGLWKDQNNVKIDLYEIDFDAIGLWGSIWMTQKFTQTLTWSMSESPAENNPRAFVWDDTQKLLYLPVSISNKYSQDYEYFKCDEKTFSSNELCAFMYNPNTSENGYYIRKIKSETQDFTGLKVFEINDQSGIKETESFSAGWADLVNSRVGYYKAGDANVSFFVDGSHITFFGTSDEKKLSFE